MNTLSKILVIALFGIVTSGFTPKSSILAKEDYFTPEPDSRIEKALKKLGLKYEVDEEGDFKLIFGFEDKRTQIVFINSKTEKLKEMEIREIWSVAAKFSSEPPVELSQALLEKNAIFKLGSYQYKKGSSGGYYLVFCVHLSANAPAEELGSALSFVAIRADQTEKEITQNDDY